MIKVFLTLPVPHGTMPFGKYKGKPFGKVPAPYFLWLRNKGCADQRVNEYIDQNYDCLLKETKKKYRRRFALDAKM